MGCLHRRLGEAARWTAVLAAAAVVLLSGSGFLQVYGAADAGGQSRAVVAAGPALLNLLLFLPVPAALAWVDGRWMHSAALPAAAVQTFLVFLLGLSIGGPHLWTSLPLVWAAAILSALAGTGGPQPPAAVPSRTA